MKELSLRPDGMVSVSLALRSGLQKWLHICGILSSILYITATILGALTWKGYDPASQAVSELIAVDAPSAPLVIPLFIIYGLLILAFAVGIWLSAAGNRPLRIASILIAAKEVLGIYGTLFAPMHMRGVDATFSDTMHMIITGVGVLLCMFPAIGFASASFGKNFRIYCIITMLVFLVFGILAGMSVQQIGSNQPTPLVGFYERINIFTYMLWIIVLSIRVWIEPTKEPASVLS